ncbi:MAG: hypothetical protein KC464_09390 [Myxococcales bacterium]|nr:hypothetical protein [Myxococcales bacterium]
MHDQLTGAPRILLEVEGHTLRFIHRGRHAAADLASSAGRAVLVAARWGPASISIEVQGGGVDVASRSLTISYGDIGRPQRMFRHISEGDDLELGRGQLGQTLGTASWCVGLVFLTKRGTTVTDLEPFARFIVHEATAVFQEFIAGGGVGDVEDGALVAFTMHVVPIELDDERFERWRTALGRPAAWSGECELAFTRHPLSKATMDSALSVLAYSFAGQLDRLVGTCGDLPELLPRVFVDTSDVFQWFWYHAFSHHFFVDEAAMAMKAELEKRINARQRAEKPVLLNAAALSVLFDVAGRDWLAAKLARRSKKESTATGARSLVRFFARDAARNSAVDAYQMFQQDRSVPALAESASVFDLWMTAAKLAADVAEISKRAPAVLNDVVARLRKAGDAAPKGEFEIEVLADLLRLGHDAEFIPTSDEPSKRTPDIKINRIDAPVYVECSQKDLEPKHVEVARDHAQQLIQYLHTQGEKRKRSVLLDLRFLDLPKPQHVQEILSLLKPAIAGGASIESTPADSQEWCFSLRDLGDHGRVWRMQSLYDIVTDASWVYATGQWYDGWSVRNHVCHATALAVSLDTSRRLLKTVENTLRDKAKYLSKGGQLPDGSPAVCAISLGVVTDEAAKQVTDGVVALVEKFSALSALVLYWSKRIAKDLVPMARGWRAEVVLNPRAKIPLPANFVLPRGVLGMTGIVDTPAGASPSPQEGSDRGPT